MNSLYVLSALMLAGSSPALMFTTWTMMQATTFDRTWWAGAIAAMRRKRDAISFERRRAIGSDPGKTETKTGEKSPATEFCRTALSPHARGRT